MDKFNNMNETEILNLAKDGDNEAISFIIQKYNKACKRVDKLFHRA